MMHTSGEKMRPLLCREHSFASDCRTLRHDSPGEIFSALKSAFSLQLSANCLSQDEMMHSIKTSRVNAGSSLLELFAQEPRMCRARAFNEALQVALIAGISLLRECFGLYMHRSVVQNEELQGLVEQSAASHTRQRDRKTVRPDHDKCSA